ncbi:hypothetical protein SELMODRAFT_431784 [Selaginella moellendorffii]|uniref:Uncharacterized protein n=1 Tax=Selaginella moellendorffii TaxID=88036 RepID=D8TDS7_SELML|nr:hypothetical protein SELMODRAFT_431784 [Selaginella moellendorffii]
MAKIPDVYYFHPALPAAPLPLQLMNPVFGLFLDIVDGRFPIQCKEEDYDFYCRLAKASSSFYSSESKMISILRDLWHRYIGIYVQEEMSTGNFSRNTPKSTDLGIRDSISDVLLGLVEVKLGFSTRSIEAMDNLKLYHCKARPKVGLVFRVGGMATAAINR